MSDLISRKALLENLIGFEYSNDVENIFDLITNAPAIEQGENVDYLEIENISQMAGLLVDTPRGLAWEFADIEKLTKFANICAERRYLPNTASAVSQNEQQEQGELVKKAVADASKEIQTLRAKVASADVLVEALKTIATESPPEIWQVAIKALATYDKLSKANTEAGNDYVYCR